MRTPGEDRDEDKDHGETDDEAPPQWGGWQPRQPEEERPGGHPR
jgi:hypothetical protein